MQHDLALLVLAKDMTIAAYPHVWSHNADGMAATQAHRTGAVASKSAIAQLDVDVASGRPSGNTFTLRVPTAASDAGGPFFRTSRRRVRAKPREDEDARRRR